MDRAFKALASSVRRRMLDLVKKKPGCKVGDVCERFPMSRIAVMKHLAVLEGADLIVSEKCGRVRRLYLNAVPIRAIYERWTTEYSGLWAEPLTRLKSRVESKETTGVSRK